MASAVLAVMSAFGDLAKEVDLSGWSLGHWMRSKGDCGAPRKIRWVKDVRVRLYGARLSP